MGGGRDFPDPQVSRHRAEAARSGQRRGGFGACVPALLGVDVVPATAGQVGPVRRGGEPAVGDPEHPVQVPAGQVVPRGPDDRGVGGVAGQAPAPDRDAVAGHRHRDHHLRQVGPEVLGVPEPAGALLDRPRDVVVIDLVLQVGELVRDVRLEGGAGHVHDDRVQIQLELVRDRSEALSGDLGERPEQHIHRRVRVVVAERRAPGIAT